MTSIIPVATGRTSDLLNQTRLLQQLNADQTGLLALETQLSTGQRLTALSDDAAAAIRAISLQSLIQQKDQVKTDLTNTSSYLNATDSAVSNVADLISKIRSDALGVAGNTASDSQKQAFREEIQQTITQLVSIGNQTFRGRYLFSGSRTSVQPFTQINQGVIYQGNDTALRSFADVGQLFDSGISGNQVFGAISPSVTGSVDLNPILTENTRLADLRGGLGISKGSVEVSDGTHVSTVDLTSANTVGDVLRLFASHPPEGRSVTARITSSGITLQLDHDTPGNLTVREVGGGTTAAELGVLNSLGVGTGLLTGGDLNPRLLPTTKLADVFGVRAQTLLDSPGDNNNLVLTANFRGAAGNGTKVQYVDDQLLQAGPGLAKGNEVATYNASAVAARASVRLSGAGNDLILTSTVQNSSANNITIQIDASQALGDVATTSYDSNTRTFTLHVDSGSQTTVDTLVAAINASGQFTAAPDASAGETYNGSAVVNAADAPIVRGNTGNSGAEANSIQIRIAQGLSTAKDVLKALQTSPTVSALFSASLDTKDTTDSFSAGSGAVNLAVSGVTSGGAGVEFDAASGIQINNGGKSYAITFTGDQTVEDLLNTINGAPANVVATINDAGTGIDIRSRLSGSDFSIGENGGQAAAQLGVRTFTRSTLLSDLNFGRGVQDATGTDFTITRADGTALSIDVSGAKTVGDVIDLINNAAGNQDPATQVVAQLATTGNGISLVDANTLGTNALTITSAFGSTAAQDLGLIPLGSTTATSTSGVGTVQSLAGSDSNPQETKGIFNSLYRLDQALVSGNSADFARASAALSDDLSRLTFARADVGARGQALDSIKTRLDSEGVDLKASLSTELDTDFADAVSKLAAKQASLEASLRLIARSFQLSLVNFL